MEGSFLISLKRAVKDAYMDFNSNGEHVGGAVYKVTFKQALPCGLCLNIIWDYMNRVEFMIGLGG